MMRLLKMTYWFLSDKTGKWVKAGDDVAEFKVSLKVLEKIHLWKRFVPNSTGLINILEVIINVYS